VDYPEIERKIEQHGPKDKAPAIVAASERAGIPFEHGAPDVEAPGVIQGGRETTQLPDGRTITKDREFLTSPKPGGLEWEERVTEREWPAGSTPTAPGAPPGSTTPPGTVVQNPGGGVATAPPPGEDKECGLPGTPACKIDETGTPTDAGMNPVQDAARAFDGLRGFLANPLAGMPSFPEISWTFQLPSTCGRIEIPAFAPFIESIDVCQFQPMFHEIMGIVWTIGALFGAISIFWRDQLSQG
jgi:hypothetical protein